MWYSLVRFLVPSSFEVNMSKRRKGGRRAKRDWRKVLQTSPMARRVSQADGLGAAAEEVKVEQPPTKFPESITAGLVVLGENGPQCSIHGDDNLLIFDSANKVFCYSCGNYLAELAIPQKRSLLRALLRW
jgi:hypothetical protein